MVARGARPGPFFCYGDGRLLTRASLVVEMNAALTRVGIDRSHYPDHSFRSGAAIITAEQGI